jgi:hypothetical protein
VEETSVKYLLTIVKTSTDSFQCVTEADSGLEAESRIQEMIDNDTFDLASAHLINGEDSILVVDSEEV